MIIRPYKRPDYDQAIELLKTCNVEPPKEPSDLNGVCIVAEDEGKIVGVLWALVGLSTTQAHLDFFAVHPDYQSQHMGWSLLKAMDDILKKMGVHRYTFFLETDNKGFGRLIEKYGKQYKTERLRDLHSYRRELV